MPSSKLREAIDFKTLASIFHSDEKKMRLIKEHQNDFLESIEKDNGETLINLLIESDLDQHIQEKVKNLLEIKKQSEKEINRVEEKKIKDLENEIKRRVTITATTTR